MGNPESFIRFVRAGPNSQVLDPKLFLHLNSLSSMTLHSASLSFLFCISNSSLLTSGCTQADTTRTSQLWEALHNSSADLHPNRSQGNFVCTPQMYIWQRGALLKYSTWVVKMLVPEFSHIAPISNGTPLCCNKPRSKSSCFTFAPSYVTFVSSFL